jgi:predicted P-loop ATPase/GTPase
VIGMNKPYKHYGDKIQGYYDFLVLNNNQTTATTTAVKDNDVVVLVDAFDVLLFPSIRRTREFLSISNSPIVFCAEQGVYPEFSSKF